MRSASLGIVLVALLGLGVTPIQATPNLAVIRISSHGASATVVWTSQDCTYLLGCAHAYTGRNRTKPMVLDIPTNSYKGQQIPAEIKLVAVDYDLDLSLVHMNVGPLEHYAPVPQYRYPHSRELWSIGYDNMKLPATQRLAHVLTVTSETTWTSERPWHGRSGGGLLDLNTGLTVGVVGGYEVTGQRRGIYTSLPAILRFLKRTGWNVDESGQQYRQPESYSLQAQRRLNPFRQLPQMQQMPQSSPGGC